MSGRETAKIVRIQFELGLIWIETADGAVYYRRIREEETIDGVRQFYESRDTVDDDCRPFVKGRDKGYMT